MGLTLAPVDPSPGLEARVVRAVARRGRAGRPRAAALAAAAAIALAAASGGWAVAMRQRVQELADAAENARGRAARFEQAVREIVGEQGGGRILSASLSPPRMRPGPGGRAVLFDSRSGEDWMLVIVGGLAEGGAPYRGFVGMGQSELPLGRLWPSAPGEMSTARFFSVIDLASASRVVIVDRDGVPVLRGVLTAGADPVDPSV